MNKVVVSAPGKINLFLKILGTNEIGYHLLQSIMQTIELSDTVTIQKNESSILSISCSDDLLPQGEENIAYKAATKFFEKANLSNQGLDIQIEKRIPSQAGLGGGSSDAAAVIKGLNYLYGTGFSLEEMCDIGVEVGADVPFCLVGGGALVEGIGEKITPLNSMADCFILIAKPPIGVSTVEAFKIYDEKESFLRQKNIEPMLEDWKTDYLDGIGRRAYNVFEDVLKLDDVYYIKEVMKVSGQVGSVMSGSGSAVVGIFDDLNRADYCKRILSEEYSDVFITKPVSYGSKIIKQ